MKKKNVFDLLFDTEHKLVLNPYHFSEDQKNLWEMFFGDNGELDWDLIPQLKSYITKNNCDWDSDPVRLYHAKQFSMNTKGNYSTVYYWR